MPKRHYRPRRAPRHIEVSLTQDDTDLAIARINDLTRVGRANWIGLLAYLAFAMVTLLGVEDIDFFVESRQTQLPLIGVSIPTGAFFYAAPILGAALHVYLHLFVRKCTAALMVPKARVNGARLETHILPWLLNDLVLRWRRDGSSEPRPLDRLATLIAVILIWIAGPAVLGYAWWQSWPAHEYTLSFSALACFLIALFASLASWARLRDDLLRVKDLWTWRRSLAILLTLFGALVCLPLTYLKTVGETLVIYDIKQTGDRLLKNPHFEFDLRLTFVDLNEAALTILPEDWIPYDVHKRRFYVDWCTVYRYDFELCSLIIGEASKRQIENDRTVWCRRVKPQQNNESCHDYFISMENRFEDAWRTERAMRRDALTAWEPRRKDFRDANLVLATLTAADLRQANMYGAKLTQAQMEGADLSGAQMQGADLTRAQMQSANFSKAQMKLSNLSGAWMQGAYFMQAELQNSSFVAAQMQAVNLVSAQLQGSDLSNAQMQGANLSKAEMQEAKLTFAEMEGAVFRYAKLTKANLRRAQLQKADLRDTEMQAADFTGAQLDGANLRFALLDVADLREAKLVKANLSGAQLEGTDFAEAQMQEVDLSFAKAQGADFFNVWMDGANLFGAQLQRAVFTMAHMQRADLSSTQMESANFRGASMHGANLLWAQMQSTNLRGAQLLGANLSLSILSGTARGRNNLTETDLGASINEGGALRFVDMYKAVFDARTDFRNVFLDGSVILPAGFPPPVVRACGWITDIINDDAEFFGKWRGWVEESPSYGTDWEEFAPETWRDVPAISPPPECQWDTSPLPGADAP